MVFQGIWSDRVSQLVSDAERDDSRWTRWFSKDGFVSKTVSDGFRLTCAFSLFCIWAYDMYYTTWRQHGREDWYSLARDYAFLTIWGLTVNLIYFTLQAMHILNVAPCNKGRTLKWTLWWGQFAFVVEVIVLVLYFLIVFQTEYADEHNEPHFWFTLICEHMFSPMVIIIDTYFNRLPHSRRLILPLVILLQVYTLILWLKKNFSKKIFGFWSTHVHPIYPGISMDDSYSAFIVIGAQLAAVAMSFGMCSLRKSQEEDVMHILSSTSGAQHLLPPAQ